MNPEFKQYLLKVTDASACEEVTLIQSLWSGYGKISRYRLQDARYATVVVKHIALNGSSAHPRGWNTDLSHQRKVHSYEVEIAWYEQWNARCTEACRTAKHLGSMTQGDEHWIILEDLNADFPLRKHQLELNEVKTCLRWLTHFHATFMQQQPEGLWPVGTYWHLATRPEELAKMQHAELKQKAPLLDGLLNNCTYKTLVHGDAKLANFCFSVDGKQVAAVDFQYVGGGCGMKDVAYFLGSCLSSHECEVHTEALLNHYFTELKQALAAAHVTLDLHALEQEWRSLYPVAWTDFTRFMLGWMPTHQKVNGYSLKVMREVLERLG